ncbi:hypothetical protein GOA97_27530 [Sinorhizobium meliloti]|nr:hypothetical protein [Sinorhizobium meliloti]MDW9658128.1 hypothetical protein [Sinorhizobium meliloti]MDW9918071.1 hypothetical protein [Sinorhizobium meliloti]MDW9942859.1 hypothetical protein [Sinorhizobium meliloti]MDW9949328.1 hypothetical protein [Sinorhizobium meliloti]
MGGYSNVKTDRGGPTKYGITQRTAALRRCLPIRSGRRAERRPPTFTGAPTGRSVASIFCRSGSTMPSLTSA